MTHFQSFNVHSIKSIPIMIATLEMEPGYSIALVRMPSTMMSRGKTTKLLPICSVIKPSMPGTKPPRNFSFTSIRTGHPTTRNRSLKASPSIGTTHLRNRLKSTSNFPLFRRKIMPLLLRRGILSRRTSDKD